MAQDGPHSGSNDDTGTYTDRATSAPIDDRSVESAPPVSQPTQEEVYCHSCGAAINAAAEICPSCGVRQHRAGSTHAGPSEKDPGIAAVISLLFPGGGQVYNEQIGRGAIIFVSYLMFWFVTVLLMLVFVGFLLMFAAPLFHVGAAWDAYDQATKINDGLVTV